MHRTHYHMLELYQWDLAMPIVPRSQSEPQQSASPSSSSGVEAQWEKLEQAVKQCTACPLSQNRKNTVFGVGNRRASWMVVGEAPGFYEDQQGEPFVGRAGQLLTAMMKAIGYERQDIYIANILKCRPPNNRDPQPSEVQTCTPFLEQQIGLIQPRLILAVGRIAARFLLHTQTSLVSLRGRMHFYQERIPLIVTYHPAYLLRNPLDKKKALDDLLYVKKMLATVEGAAA